MEGNLFTYSPPSRSQEVTEIFHIFILIFHVQESKLRSYEGRPNFYMEKIYIVDNETTS